MGTPRRQRRKYTRPKHPWNMERITEEKELCMKYGLKNKTELWRAKSELGRIRTLAKKLQAVKTDESQKETKELIDKFVRIGINAKDLDEILGFTIEKLLERRLQSIVYKRGLANTMRQARQYINHNHVFIGNHKVTVPGYMVLAKEEDTVRVSEEMVKKTDKRASQEAALRDPATEVATEIPKAAEEPKKDKLKAPKAPKAEEKPAEAPKIESEKPKEESKE